VEFVYLPLTMLISWWGARTGRKASAIGLAVCLALVAIASVWIQSLVAQSGLAGWQFHSDNKWAPFVGMTPVFSALALIGPILTTNKPAAIGISLVIVSLFVFTFIPMIATACVLYAMCI